MSRYTVALARALGDVAREFPDLQLRVVTTARGSERIGDVGLEVRTLRPRNRLLQGGAGRILLEQAHAASSRADLLFFFDVSGPLLAPRKPFVATIHDTSVVHGFGMFRQAHKRLLYPWALRKARATVAVSAFARDEALEHFELDPLTIRVVHSGPGFTPIPLVPNGRDFGLEERRFFLYVGNLNANKNLPFLVRAYDRAGLATPLVLAGRRGEGFEELEAAVEEASAPVELVFDASDGEIDSLYRRATALLLPSRYEGFGFTPLEAMSRDCPVLVSDIPALREIAGEGALVLPLDDEQAWSEAITAVSSDASLQQSLRKRGRECVARYSWETTARGVCELLTTVEA